MDSTFQLMKLETLFQLAGVDYRQMTPGTSVDVTEKGLFIRSFDHDLKKEVKSRILALYRKEDSPYHYIIQIPGGESLKVSPTHKVYTPSGYEYVEKLDSTAFVFSSDAQDFIEVTISRVDDPLPILDMKVDTTENYFSNGILSHNTTPGGKAVRFYSSWRARVSKMEDLTEKQVVVGNRIKVRNVKNKVGVPKRVAELDLYYATGFNPDNEYLDFIIDLGVVEKRGGWYYQEEWGLKAHGREDVMAFLSANPDRFEEAKKKVNDSFVSALTLDNMRTEEPTMEEILE